MKIPALLAVSLILAAAAPLPPESEWPPVTPPRGPVAGLQTDRTIKVADGIYVAIVGGQNLVVSVGDDGLLLSDDQDVPLVPRVRAQLAKISGKPVRYVVNSHWHYDHVGGNPLFAKDGALIIAHDNTRNSLGIERYNPISARKQGPFAPSYLPALTFSQRMTLHINGDDIELIHTPAGHTDGDVVIYFRKANVIVLNDVFTMEKSYPGIEIESGASIQGLIAAYDMLLPMLDANTIVIPARGPLAHKDDVAAFRDVLVTARDKIAALMRAGKSEDEIVAARPTSDYDGQWHSDQRRIDNLVREIYYGLKNPPR